MLGVGAMLTLGCSSSLSEVGASDGGASTVVDGGLSVGDGGLSVGDASAQCTTVTDMGMSGRVGCVYPGTCSYATLQGNLDLAGDGPSYAVSPTELWTAAPGYLLRAVMDDRPRMELIPVPVADPIAALWGSGANDVWVAGNEATRAFVYHWDGCRWTRHDGPTGLQVVTMAGAEPGRPWMGSGTSLVQWTGTAWATGETTGVEGAAIGHVYAAPGGRLYGVARDERQRLFTVYRRDDSGWTPAAPTQDASGLRLAFGRDWVAVSTQMPSQRDAAVMLYRGSAAPERVGQLPVEGLASAGDRPGVVVQSRTGFYDQGRLQQDALDAALTARGVTALTGAEVLSNDSDPLGLMGVRWYRVSAVPGGPGGRLVGCTMRAGQVRCIGALEASYNLNEQP